MAARCALCGASRRQGGGPPWRPEPADAGHPPSAAVQSGSSSRRCREGPVNRRGCARLAGGCGALPPPASPCPKQIKLPRSGVCTPPRAPASHCTTHNAHPSVCTPSEGLPAVVVAVQHLQRLLRDLQGMPGVASSVADGQTSSPHNQASQDAGWHCMCPGAGEYPPKLAQATLVCSTHAVHGIQLGSCVQVCQVAAACAAYKNSCEGQGRSWRCRGAARGRLLRCWQVRPAACWNPGWHRRRRGSPTHMTDTGGPTKGRQDGSKC